MPLVLSRDHEGDLAQTCVSRLGGGVGALCKGLDTE